MTKSKATTGRRRLRSREWFDDPTNVDMTALYLERYMNYGLSLAELQSRHGEHDLEELFFRLISDHDSSSKFQVSGSRLAESTID